MNIDGVIEIREGLEAGMHNSGLARYVRARDAPVMRGPSLVHPRRAGFDGTQRRSCVCPFFVRRQLRMVAYRSQSGPQTFCLRTRNRRRVVTGGLGETECGLLRCVARAYMVKC